MFDAENHIYPTKNYAPFPYQFLLNYYFQQTGTGFN